MALLQVILIATLNVALRYGRALAQARGAVTGAGLLAGLGLPTAPAALRDIGREAALALVRTLLARVARSSPAPSDARCGRRSGAHKGYEAQTCAHA